MMVVLILQRLIGVISVPWLMTILILKGILRAMRRFKLLELLTVEKVHSVLRLSEVMKDVMKVVI